MNDNPQLIQVTDQNLKEFLIAERAVLILATSDCGYCTSYQTEIEALLSQQQMAGIAIGKLVLNQRGAIQFKRDNTWLASLESLPYTLLYYKGQPLGGFAASKGSYLVGRVEHELPQQA